MDGEAGDQSRRVRAQFEAWLTIHGVMLSLRSIWHEAGAPLGQARALCAPDPSGLKSLRMTTGFGGLFKLSHCQTAASREAAGECSPGRKPWVHKRVNDIALKRRKKRRLSVPPRPPGRGRPRLRGPQSYASAITSISTSTSLGRRATSTVDRAGGATLK
jgi:hypothetical protein